ncbi:bifunctional ornithine acetyltransferase/N-acetylglutamate synthase [Streptomyces sp. NPDC088846]|uniref:bifunctional ornithine acetyltransferase/N-acetylglutamate synthase n=1 Tax=Streptomyces sp. NPDC088846 TaxID=3365908 RepID=UPI00381B9166
MNLGPSHGAAGVFTPNPVQAAPVRRSRHAVPHGAQSVVVLDSDGADACTGPVGEGDPRAVVERTARAVGAEAGRVAVCSTGLIGVGTATDRGAAGISTKAVHDVRLDPARRQAAGTAGTPREFEVRFTDREFRRSGDLSECQATAAAGLHAGRASAAIPTNGLTAAYVHGNSGYGS